MKQLTQLAVVALKPFGEAKLRLGGVLSDERRAALAHRMATHVITTANSVLPTAVVSRDHDVLAMAESLGAIPIPERVRPGLQVGGLNEALDDATDFAHDCGAKLLVILAGDLPLLSADDVSALVRLPGLPGLVVARDHAGTGTNALAMSPPGATAHQFGPGSLHAHRRRALLSGLPVVTLDRSGLCRDIDTPDDLDWVISSGALSVIDRELYRPDADVVGSPPTHEPRPDVESAPTAPAPAEAPVAGAVASDAAREDALPGPGELPEHAIGPRVGRLGKRLRKPAAPDRQGQ